MCERRNAMEPPLYLQQMRRFNLSAGKVSMKFQAECSDDDIRDDIYEPAEQSAAAENMILS